MITYSTVDGWLKGLMANPKVRQWLLAGFIAACAMAPLFISQYMLEWSMQQTDAALREANFWQREALKWRAIAAAYQCPSDTSICKAGKCLNVCTGESSMDMRP